MRKFSAASEGDMLTNSCAEEGKTGSQGLSGSAARLRMLLTTRQQSMNLHGAFVLPSPTARRLEHQRRTGLTTSAGYTRGVRPTCPSQSGVRIGVLLQ